ncbi:hypothetical protein ACLB2K_047061 [Fragaria x ananassa]
MLTCLHSSRSTFFTEQGATMDRTFVPGKNVDSSDNNCRVCRLSLNEVERTWNRCIVRGKGCLFLRCFGILQALFGIIKGAARGWDNQDLRYIMLACIILHNIIVEDESPEDSDEDLGSDEEEDNNMRPTIAEVWDGPTG